MRNSSISFLTVTYNKDFKILNRLLASINKHNPLDFIHYIILNDSIEYKNELQSIIDNYPSLDIRLIHFEEITEMLEPLRNDYKHGFRYTDGWITQQILTLTSARVVETEYYCNLNSKDYLIRPITIGDVMKESCVLADRERFNYGIPDHQNVSYMFLLHFINAYKLFDLHPWDYMNATMLPHTPAVLKTEYVNLMLDHFSNQNISVLDLIGHNNGPTYPTVKETNKTNEYYLYSAWLAKNQLSDTVCWKDDRTWNFLEFSKELN